MREYHRVDQSDLRGEGHSQQCRNSRENICAKEDTAKRSRVHTELHMEPVRDHALHNQPAGECIKCKESTQFKNDFALAMQAESFFDICFYFGHFDCG